MKSNIEPVFYGTTMTPSDLGEWYLSKGPGGCEDANVDVCDEHEQNSEADSYKRLGTSENEARN